MIFHDWYGIGRVLIASAIGYIGLVTFLRVSGKRTLAKMNAFDLVVTVALGSSFATMLLSKQVAIAEGLVAFVALIGLQYLVALTTLRSKSLREWTRSEPTLLFHRGEPCCAALARERVTMDALRAAVRSQGIASLDHVEAIVLETSGDLSVVRRDPEHESTALDDVKQK